MDSSKVGLRLQIGMLANCASFSYCINFFGKTLRLHIPNSDKTKYQSSEEKSYNIFDSNENYNVINVI